MKSAVFPVLPTDYLAALKIYDRGIKVSCLWVMQGTVARNKV